MHVVRVNSTPERIGAAVGPLGINRAGTASVYRERIPPTAAALLWAPIGKPTGDSVSPIFIVQTALEAVHAQAAALPDGASSLGFFVGTVYTAPETGAPYVVIESTVRIPWAIAGDHLESALLQGRAIAQAEVDRTDKQLLGWYHTLVAGQARLSVADAQAHVACFDQMWSVAMVVARGDELTGGVFRVGTDAMRVTDCLPFFVLQGTDAPAAPWGNYRAHRVSTGAAGSPLAAPAKADTPPLLFPDEDDEPDDLPVPVRSERFEIALPGPRTVRIVRYAAIGLVGVGAVFGGYWAIAPGGLRGATDAAPRAVVIGGAELDRLADSVTYAVAAFDLRARLFADRKMACVDLARGLVELEERWITHNAARRQAAATSDSVRGARDRRLNADVSASEQRFARTGCPRP